MKLKQLLSAIERSSEFTELSHNNTYIITSLSGLNDPGVYCRPGGQRAFLNLIFEQREGGVPKVSLNLVPPNTSYEAQRRRALDLIRPEKQRKRDNYFITLINFNAITRELSSPDRLLELLAGELQELKLAGRPSQMWSRQNNLITDWSELFELSRLAVLAREGAEPTPRSLEPLEPETRVSLSTQAPEAEPRSFQRVLFLGAEFNEERGDLRSMDVITQEALRGGARSEESYFKIIKAQLESLKLRGSVYFDDVSIVPAGGQHSSPERYRENVRLSKWFHRRLLSSYQPDLVVIGGSQAMREYVDQVLDEREFTALSAPIVLQVRNASRQGHWGSIEHKWLRLYQELDAHQLLREAMSAHPGQRHFKLMIPRSGGASQVVAYP